MSRMMASSFCKIPTSSVLRLILANRLSRKIVGDRRKPLVRLTVPWKARSVSGPLPPRYTATGAIGKSW